jgi:hypothetical protein
MGLDVTAFSKIKPADPTAIAKASDDLRAKYGDVYLGDVADELGAACIQPELLDITAYHYPAQVVGLEAGVYTYDGEFSWRAGSYGGYNEWRRILCKRVLGVGPEVVWPELGSFTGRPFVELIAFSDCEGYIGATVSAKLAADFSEWQSRIDDVDEWWLGSYASWRRGFEIAADGGFVYFR